MKTIDEKIYLSLPSSMKTELLRYCKDNDIKVSQMFRIFVKDVLNGNINIVFGEIKFKK